MCPFISLPVSNKLLNCHIFRLVPVEDSNDGEADDKREEGEVEAGSN